MHAKTKILVLRMRELIYTSIFLALLAALVLVMILMFRQKPATSSLSPASADVAAVSPLYTPGIYTTSVTLGSHVLDLAVTVSYDQITHIGLVNLSETVASAYPLVEPALEELSTQIYEKQSTEDLTYSEDSRYTSQVLQKAVETALSKAETAW